jgi:hypothetical protein
MAVVLYLYYSVQVELCLIHIRGDFLMELKELFKIYFELFVLFDFLLVCISFHSPWFMAVKSYFIAQKKKVPWKG